MSKDTHFPPVHWKSKRSLAGLNADEYHANIEEKKKNKRIKQKYFQYLFNGTSNPKQRKKSSPSEEHDIPDLDLETELTEKEEQEVKENDEEVVPESQSCSDSEEEEVKKSASQPKSKVPYTLVSSAKKPSANAASNESASRQPQPSTRLVDQHYEKRIAELQGENARLKYHQGELLKETARMSSSYDQMKSIRNLLAAKVKVANPEEDRDELLKLGLPQLVCRYESAVVPLTSSSSKKEVERLREKVEKLEAKKKSLKEKLVAAKSATSNDMQSLKEDIIKAMNNDSGGMKKAHEEIASLKETIVELKTKKRLQYELNAAQQNQELELKKVLELPENTPMYLIVEKVKEMKETVSRLYEENEVQSISVANETINQHFANTSGN